MRKAKVLVFLLIIPALAYAGELPVFVNVTREAGINFRHTFGDEHMSSILESTGPGCAFLDYDQDGYLDIYMVNGCYLEGISDPDSPYRGQRLTNRLYRNNGDGTFTDVTEEAGVGDTGYGMGVVVGDYDNDGYPDIYVTNYGPNVLYRNNGDGTFTDVTEEAGVGCPLWSVGGCFLDYDNDGDLDLYVGNYLEFDPDFKVCFSAEVFPGPLSYAGQPDVLYRNNGDGTFTDVTREAGVYNPEGRAMSVGAGDFDGDGDLDIFVCNDAMENYLYRNNGDGTFTDVALEVGAAMGEFGEAVSSMSPDFADYDNDGDLDIFVPDMGYCCLYRNMGGSFEEYTAPAGVAAVLGQYISWAGYFIDYDNDGWKDLFLVNGDAHHLYPEEDILFRNNHDGTFTDVALQSGDYFTKEEYIGRGAAFGDYDNDGDIDIYVANLNGPGVLLRNDGGNRNSWLILKLVGIKSNRDAVGAWVTVRAGDLVQVGQVRAGGGYLSSSDIRLYFGLGSHSKVDEVEIRWPSGIVQKRKNVAANQILTITEPAEMTKGGR